MVGDGNTDLEDQHNSATLGANRGGIADFGTSAMGVGRGNVIEQPKGATEARVSSAGANYFGRSTGLADKLIDDMTEDQEKSKRMDSVRAQQKENWFNQRAIHSANRAAGQGVVFGETSEGRPSSGGYIAREAISSDACRTGARESEISQHDLAKHMDNLASLPAERLDGQEWGELVITDADPVEAVFEMRASPRQTAVEVMNVVNDYNTFAPYRCGFVAGSSGAFTVSPAHGSMNRRSGAPVEVTVRFSPEATGSVNEATLVFETEDMKKIYKFIGST